jgi:3-hydroxybutyryl-CoA dehydrogenase
VHNEVLWFSCNRLHRRLGLAQRLGHVSPEQAASALPRIGGGTVLQDSVADADLVVEAVAENLPLKQQIFRTLDAVCPRHTILASTTSTLLRSALASATRPPDRVIVAHYFNPPALVPLVEGVRGPNTSDETVTTECDLLVHVGKRPALIDKEVIGFISVRLQAALGREAGSLVERGVATPEDIDTRVKYSFGRRLAVASIFEIADLAGLDIYMAVGPVFQALESSTGVPAILRDKVERGDLGVKTGQGFYTWTPESAAALRERIGRALVERT